MRGGVPENSEQLSFFSRCKDYLFGPVMMGRRYSMFSEDAHPSGR